jgi:hypothetical protein
MMAKQKRDKTPAQERIEQLIEMLQADGWEMDGRTRNQKFRLPVSTVNGMGYKPLDLGGRIRLVKGGSICTIGKITVYFQGGGASRNIRLNSGVQNVFEESMEFGG